MDSGNFRERLSVTGSEGVSVQIEVATQTWILFRTEDRTPRSFDPFLTLRLANGDDVTDDDSAGDLNARIIRDVPAGNHQVILTDVSNGSGSAILEIRSLDPQEAFNLLPLDSTLSRSGFPREWVSTSITLNFANGGTISPTTRFLGRNGEIFQFDVSEGISATFDIVATATDRGADLEMSLHKLDGETATFLEYNDDSGRSLNPRITRRLEDGTYLLRVRERSRNRTQATINITRSQ